MNFEFYLKKFNNSLRKLNKNRLKKKHLEASVGIIYGSVFLKLYKKEWTGDTNDPMNAAARIFFSVWVNETTIQKNRIYYNIHALKLRQLKDYKITSKNFAENFREKFKNFQDEWEHVSVKFGPLTLMEGWKELDINNIEKIIVTLANQFMKIAHLIDNTLQLFEHKQLNKTPGSDI